MGGRRSSRREIMAVQVDAISRGAFGMVHYVCCATSRRRFFKAVSKSRTKASAVHSSVTTPLEEIIYGEARYSRSWRCAPSQHAQILRVVGHASHAYTRAAALRRVAPVAHEATCVHEQVAAKVIYDLLQALTFCHTIGVVHRDVKPQNLLFTSFAPDAYLKLADWGLATHWREGQAPLSEFCGTLDFASPEMLDASYTATTDVWSAGVILVAMLSGRNPFRGPSKAATEHRVRAFDPSAADESDFAASPRQRAPWPSCSCDDRGLAACGEAGAACRGSSSGTTPARHQSASALQASRASAASRARPGRIERPACKRLAHLVGQHLAQVAHHTATPYHETRPSSLPPTASPAPSRRPRPSSAPPRAPR